ncbi:hypothetical protein R1flu_001165 [Riccia fluitans]|uniref:Uncharacterized protein n=1 Tax=Riccia fluitans TaxID=41844 RepID=A0ABD1Y2Y5_9MARC
MVGVYEKRPGGSHESSQGLQMNAEDLEGALLECEGFDGLGGAGKPLWHEADLIFLMETWETEGYRLQEIPGFVLLDLVQNVRNEANG